MEGKFVPSKSFFDVPLMQEAKNNKDKPHWPKAVNTIKVKESKDLSQLEVKEGDQADQASQFQKETPQSNGFKKELLLPCHQKQNKESNKQNEPLDFNCYKKICPKNAKQKQNFVRQNYKKGYQERKKNFFKKKFLQPKNDCHWPYLSKGCLNSNKREYNTD